MSENEANNAAAAPDELAMLKQRATTMGITFSNNIGLEALRAKVNDKIKPEDEDENQVEVENTDNSEFESVSVVQGGITDDERSELEALRAAMIQMSAKSETETIAPALNPLAGDKKGSTASANMSLRQRVNAEAMALVRCRITNLDPKKKDLHGEILCVGNRFIGTVKKFIPYGELTDDGFHVPKVLYDELDSRRFLHIQTKRNKQNGQIEVRTSYAKEFSLEVLPPLTPDELNKLAAAQQAASANT